MLPTDLWLYTNLGGNKKSAFKVGGNKLAGEKDAAVRQLSMR